MTSLSAPITIVRPEIIEFGVGVAPRLGKWAAAQGFSRVLVVSDGFNASRIDILELPGTLPSSRRSDLSLTPIIWTYS